MISLAIPGGLGDPAREIASQHLIRSRVGDKIKSGDGSLSHAGPRSAGRSASMGCEPQRAFRALLEATDGPVGVTTGSRRASKLDRNRKGSPQRMSLIHMNYIVGELSGLQAEMQV
jgi:hypothetical protein